LNEARLLNLKAYGTMTPEKLANTPNQKFRYETLNSIIEVWWKRLHKDLVREYIVMYSSKADKKMLKCAIFPVYY